jgi:hypothetical protein
MSTVINDIDTSLNVLEQSASGTSSTNTAVYDAEVDVLAKAFADRFAKLSKESSTELLALALSTGRCPPGIQLDLRPNKIGDIEAAQLAYAISTSRYRSGLQLNLGSNAIGKTILDQTDKPLEANEKKHAAITWIAFHQGLKPSHPLLKKIPDAVAQRIFSFLAPRDVGENLRLFFTQLKHKACPELSSASTNTSTPPPQAQ